ELLDVSADLVRFGKHLDAVDVLERGLARFPNSFLLRANLATAYYLAAGGADLGLLDRALENIKAARLEWPASPDQLEPGQRPFFDKLKWKDEAVKDVVKDLSPYQFYRQAEDYLHRLMQGRKAETIQYNAAKGTLKKKDLLKQRQVDALFTDP